jgi:hypothetical protein
LVSLFPDKLEGSQFWLAAALATLLLLFGSQELLDVVTVWSPLPAAPRDEVRLVAAGLAFTESISIYAYTKFTAKN